MYGNACPLRLFVDPTVARRVELVIRDQCDFLPPPGGHLPIPRSLANPKVTGRVEPVVPDPNRDAYSNSILQPKSRLEAGQACMTGLEGSTPSPSAAIEFCLETTIDCRVGVQHYKPEVVGSSPTGATFI